MKTLHAILASMLISATSASVPAGFTGFSSGRVMTAEGNTQYSIYANFDSFGLPSGSSWVFLNAYNYVNVQGSMQARHQDAAEDESGNPSCSWLAGVNFLGSQARENDSWLSSTGLGTPSGDSTTIDANCPAFPPGCETIPTGAGWFDATPGTQNLVAAGGASGFRIKLIQIVRTGDDSTNGMGTYTGSMSITYKVQNSSAPLSGSGQFSIGIPAPGAVALAGLAGLTGRRRR
jgi:hypothetical protein